LTPILIGVALFLVAGSASRLVRAQDNQLYDATYVYAGGEAQRTGFLHAIDKVVDQMNVLVRGLARERLHSRLKIEPRIVF